MYWDVVGCREDVDGCRRMLMDVGGCIGDVDGCRWMYRGC